MNERELELIELIQSQLPADLTEEQLEELRTVMRTSAPLRDAILDELRLEQGLATRLAPEGMQPDEWVDHISRVASARRRSKFIWINSIILVAALLIGGGVMLVSSIQVEKTPEVASNDNPGEGEVQPANREPDKTDKKDDKPDKAR
ncbi:MAG: hypothetical protein GC159_24260, partial [Phycisphaera sp.]|nr:hypothetical protein [Phycisphaera sp.]